MAVIGYGSEFRPRPLADGSFELNNRSGELAGMLDCLSVLVGTRNSHARAGESASVLPLGIDKLAQRVGGAAIAAGVSGVDFMLGRCDVLGHGFLL